LVNESAVIGLAAVLLLSGGAVAALLLRRAWAERGPSRPWLILGGWAVIVAVIVAPGFVLGAARGPFVGLALVSVAALGVVVQGLQTRKAKVRGDKSLAPEPSERPSKAWRGWLRGLLAGPLGMIAAMGVAICFAVWAAPGAQTRLAIGGLMVPVLWGGAMAWTLADDRILRATAVLVGITLITFTAAVLRGFS
jgi:hypothetical protein